jgi:hypothetical protein
VEGKAVNGMYPGATKQVKLTVVNPYDFHLRLQSLGGKIAKTSRRGCAPTAANLEVRGYSGTLPVDIRPRSRTALAGGIPVMMPRSATAECADVKFFLTLSGIGAKVSR